MSKLPFILILIYVFSQQVFGQEIEDYVLGDPISVLGDENNGSFLNQPSDLVAGNEDTIYVLDGRDQVVVAFGLNGEELFRFGREGEGPGEFRQPLEIAFAGNSVLISDNTLTRIEEFSTDGRYLRSIKLKSPHMGGLAVHNENIFVGAITENTLIYKIPLSDNAEQIPFLTFDHPQLSHIYRQNSFPMMGMELGVSPQGLLVAFPSLGSYMVIPWDEDPNQTAIIEPVCDLLTEEWKSHEERRENALRRGVISVPQMFSDIMEWSDSQLLLGIRTGQAATFKLIVIIIDSVTGEEVQPRIVTEDTGYGPDYVKVVLLHDEYLALLNIQKATVDIFRKPFP